MILAYRLERQRPPFGVDLRNVNFFARGGIISPYSNLRRAAEKEADELGLARGPGLGENVL